MSAEPGWDCNCSTQLREAVQVERLTGERRLIDLEIARVDQHALGGAHDDRHAIRHAVRDANEFDLKRADRDRVAGADGRDPGAVLDVPFLELAGHECQRQRRAVKRTADMWQHVRHGADVILVPVRQDQALDLPTAFLEIGEVGNDQIDAQQIRLGKHRAGVDEMVVLRHEMAIMFRPNSPRPPSGTISTGGALGATHVHRSTHLIPSARTDLGLKRHAN